ncbi:ATP-grasp fold amidoligase family protein [Cohnella cholangitidis]|uniref:Glycosyl transferase n=1 Tax=Cohnella cholangitidis TaxID=2598458 RepID=A0A7G5BS76_9BACL|nr:ATP-grasp fold amidoligase family protein [Cohnella cholangitidis]QMV39810.1 hypothetical protein FPL14_00255 [Cohnella cholangitidis]
MQWIKLNGNLERFAKYVDKFKVRRYVSKRIGESYLVPIIGIYKKVSQIPIESLPQSFVMKATHGSGWNINVKDKTKVDWEKTSAKLKEWLRSNYYDLYREPNYKPLKGRILIEHRLEDPSGDLKDYKFFCFHGKPVYVQVDGDRYKNHKRDIYDLNWNRLPFKAAYPNFPQLVHRPDALDQMTALAARLAKGFAMVRVDLYYTNNRIYFGELTFTPESGFKHYPMEYEMLLSGLLDLSKYN